MDLRLYAQVLWRFKLIVAPRSPARDVPGAPVRGSREFERVHVPPGGALVEHDSPQRHAGGLSMGSALCGGAQRGMSDIARRRGSKARDPDRRPAAFQQPRGPLRQLTTSDPVRRVIRRSGPIKGQLIANPLVAGGDIRILLPLIDIDGDLDSPLGAVTLAERGANALQRYLGQQQRADKVPRADRVVIERSSVRLLRASSDRARRRCRSSSSSPSCSQPLASHSCSRTSGPVRQQWARRGSPTLRTRPNAGEPLRP